MCGDINSKSKGFSLIELSVVLVLIGLLMAGAVSAFSLHLKRQQVVATKSNLTAAIDAIAAFRDKNGYYPCPASGTATPPVATDCAAATAPAGTATASTATGQRVRIGVVPVSAPNKDGNMVQILRGEQAVDGFKNRLAYAVVQTMATTPEAYKTAGAGSIVIKDSNNLSGAPLHEEAAFIVFSHGPDGAGAYTASGALNAPCNTSSIDGENCNGDAIFADNSLGPRSLTGGNDNYDDFVGTAALTQTENTAGVITGTVFLTGPATHAGGGAGVSAGGISNAVSSWGDIRTRQVVVGKYSYGLMITCPGGKPTMLSYGTNTMNYSEGQASLTGVFVTSALWACVQDGSGSNSLLLTSLTEGFTKDVCPPRIALAGTSCSAFKDFFDEEE
ncbi:MAG: prepilin-type N-terminal cleavage/methylation domain-containing protein [Micavibrio sp.]